jgi:tetratricopeptide (TPR) repeat protein
MRKFILLAIIIGFISFNSKNAVAQEKVMDNPELIEIYKSDQADRTTQNIDWNIVQKNDSIRESRVYELLDSNKVRTSEDYNNAALIFHHGEDSIAYGMAVKLLEKSIELDSTRSKWLLAAAIDRDLLSRNKPQIYGTQYKRLDNKVVVREEMDTTKITDKERIEYGVETLAQQREKIKRLNLKKLTELLNEGKSVAEIIKFVKQEDIKESQYDLSEGWINRFGYQLMNQEKKEEALKIFKLNTELNPNGFNAFDSYGECLLDLGYKEKAITAYKKSLELNPENKNAKKVLSEMK